MKLDTDKMLATVNDGIGWVTFNNPARRNAISLDMWEALATILEAFQFDDLVRVVVLKGAGDKAFVSGADISEFDTKRSTASQKDIYAKTMSAANYWLAKIDKPKKILGLYKLSHKRKRHINLNGYQKKH